MAKKTNRAKGQKPGKKPEERADKEAEMWMALVRVCKRQRRKLVEKGDKAMAQVLGEDDPFGENLSSLGFDVKMLAPKLKSFLDPIVSSVMAREPRVRSTPRSITNDLLVKRADLMKDLLEKEGREHQLKLHARMAIKEAIMYPLSGMLCDFDTERDLPRASWLSIKNLLWDTAGNGISSSIRWCGHEITVPIHVARRKYAKKPDGSDIQPDSSFLNERDEIKRREIFESSPSIDEADFTKMKTLIQIWYRADEPLVDDANPKSEDNKIKQSPKEQGEEPHFFPDKNTMYVIDPMAKKVLFKGDWGFTIEHDSLPIKFLVPEPFPGRIAAISTLSPYTHIQTLLNWFYTTAANTFLRTSRLFYLYKPEHFPEGFQETLRSAQNVSGIPTSDIEDLTKLEKVFRTLDLGSITDSNFQALGIFERLFDEVSQSDDFTAGAIAGVSKATTAQLAQNRVETRIGMIADQIEDWMSDIMRSKAQIALSKMGGPDVGKWIGEDRLGEESVEMLVDDVGNIIEEVTLRQFWVENLTPEQIRYEVDIEVAPGSMRKRSTEEEVNNELLLMDRTIADMAVMDETLAQNGERIDPRARLRVRNAAHARIGDLLGHPDIGNYFINEGDIIPATPPQPEPAQQGLPPDALGGIPPELLGLL